MPNRLLATAVAVVVITSSLALRAATTATSQQPRADDGPPPAFEVISIKENKDPSPTRRAGFLPGSGRFIADSAPLRMVITAAYADVTMGPMGPGAAAPGMFSGTAGPLPGFQLAGGPDWIDSVAYDIQATSSESDMPGSRMRQMLRALLADRFKMTTRV